jgi:hypothetical protein
MPKLKNLSVISPSFTNALLLVFCETYKDEQLPSEVIRELLIDFTSTANHQITPPFIFLFSLPAHIEIGAFFLSSFYRWIVLGELNEEKSYGKFHLKILECMSSIEMTSISKPIVYTKYLELIIDIIQRAAKSNHDPEKIQRAMEKFAQLIQVSKSYLYGNIPLLFERLKSLPKNQLMDIIIAMK